MPSFSIRCPSRRSFVASSNWSLRPSSTVRNTFFGCSPRLRASSAAALIRSSVSMAAPWSASRVGVRGWQYCTAEPSLSEGGTNLPFIDIHTVQPMQLFPGCRIRTPYGQNLMLSYVEIDPGADVPPHHHPHEQAGMVLSGRLEFTIGEETRTVEAGAMFL